MSNPPGPAAAGPLDRQSIRRWLGTIDPNLWPGVTGLERVEKWVLDDPGSEIAEAIRELAEWLMTHNDPAAPTLSLDEQGLGDMLRVLAFIRAHRALWLLHVAGETQQGLGERMLALCAAAQAEGHPLQREANVLLQRLTHLGGNSILVALFKKDRREKIIAMLDRGFARGEEDET